LADVLDALLLAGCWLKKVQVCWQLCRRTVVQELHNLNGLIEQSVRRW
jgi:hypothetical protein